MIDLFCPYCKKKLEADQGSYYCGSCTYKLDKDGRLLIDASVAGLREADFYDGIYGREKGAAWLQGLKRSGRWKKVLESVSLSYRRERFFKRHLSGRQNLILDLGCGAGREMLKSYGKVAGIDLSVKPLRLAAEMYDLAVLSDIKRLPFADDSFDYVTSADLFGHIEAEDKEQIYREICRVLKPGGSAISIIETDSLNYWFRFAHKWPELFHRYFIVGIGGHFGLELPTEAAKRWQRSGLEVVCAEKIWGTVWPIQDYLIFDNEYKGKSMIVDIAAQASSALSANRFVKIAVNILLNPINSLVESFSDLNHGQGLMIVCRKK